MLAFTIVTAILSLIGVILNIYKRKECFYIWAATNTAWVIVSLAYGVYARAALDFVYINLAIWGIWKWRQDGNKKV